MHDKHFPLITIIGPTAVGKTDLSISLAEKLNAEIISGDSMQVYKYMDIGTAKISEKEMSGIPHHLIDILEPTEAFNAIRFKELAEKTIDEIYQRHHLPMIVGGTGLYINGLLYDYNFLGDTNIKYRSDLENIDTKILYQMLLKIRPDIENSIHENDRFRIMRALEIIKTSGKDSLKAFDMKENYFSKYDLCLIGLNMDRSLLYERINYRVDKMLAEGLLEELEDLLKKGYNEEMQALKAIGYKELILYLKGKLSFNDAVELLKKNTRHFAKRQITWFKRDPNIKWFYVDQYKKEELTTQVLNFIKSSLQI